MLEIMRTFFNCSILVMSVYIFGIIIFNNGKLKISIKDILAILLCTALHSTAYLLLEGTEKTILSMLSFSLLIKISFDIDFIKSLFSSILYSIFTIIPDLVVLAFVTKVLNMSKDYCYSIFAGSMIGNIVISIIMILIIYILRKPLKKLFSYKISKNIEIVLVSLLTLVTIAIFFYKLINNYKFTNDVLAYLLVIITLVIILSYLFRQNIENQTMFKKYDDLLTIMRNYESDIEEQRTTTHETRNELLTIRCRVEKFGDEKLCEYIDSIMGDKKNVDSAKYSKFKYLPTNGLKGFLYYKFIEAEEKGISVKLNISKQIEKSFLIELNTKDFKDLTRILGVYLDNAIEASSSSQNKQLGIEIYKIKSNIEIIISNTYDNIIDEDKIGNERFSTKGENRGHGLLLVSRILKNNPKFESETKKTDSLYIQTLKIKDK